MFRIYTDEEIHDWLKSNLPAWRLVKKHLTRTYTTGNWRLTLLLANTIAYLAEAGWHHPEMILSYKHLTVKLQTHDAGNEITDRDFEMAKKIEEIATWQPAENDALEGRPCPWVV